jgi:hypothetical protein
MHIKCFAEKLDSSRTRFDVRATLTRSANDGWDPLGDHRIHII